MYLQFFAIRLRCFITQFYRKIAIYHQITRKQYTQIQNCLSTATNHRLLILKLHCSGSDQDFLFDLSVVVFVISVWRQLLLVYLYAIRRLHKYLPKNIIYSIPISYIMRIQMILLYLNKYQLWKYLVSTA